MKKYIVFFLRGARIGSVPLTDDNLRQAKEQMNLGLIQRDITGTEHYAIFGLNKKKGAQPK